MSGFVWSEEGWTPDLATPGPRRARTAATIRAYVPGPIAEFRPALDAATITALADADRLVREAQIHADGAGVGTIADGLMRSEAIASSQIEGVDVPGHRALAKALVKTGAGPARLTAPAIAVVANLRAVHAACERARRPGFGFTRDDIVETHRALGQADRWLAGHAGVIRTTQNWIGRDSYSPVDADFVPPPARAVPALLDDLAVFCSRSDLSGTLQAAVAHAQFETIHPFADGNGRVGRILIGQVLCAARLAGAVVPPVSLVLSGQR